MPTAAARRSSYGWLRETSNRLANTLRAHGIARGDRVAILLPQAPEVAAIHIAIYKLAAVALPLAALFGVDAIAYRLQDAGAKALITERAGLGQARGHARSAAGPRAGAVGRRRRRRRRSISTTRLRGLGATSRRRRRRPTTRR